MARLTIHGTPGGAGRCGTSLVAHVAFSAVVGLCYQGCGATQENEVRPLTPTTFVYAFEPGLVYAYKIDASGQIAGVSGARFRIADREWERVVADPAGRFLFAIVGDPGEIWVYALDADTGAPDLVRGSPFVPRRPHVLRGAVVAPLNPVLYVVGEPGADLRGDVSAFRFDPVAGTLTELDASPFSTGFEPFRTWVDPEGRRLYVANNGGPNRKQSLAAYSVDPATGALTAVPGSPYETPTFTGYLQFHPSGRFLYATAGDFFLPYAIGSDGSLSALPAPSEPATTAVDAYVRALSATADGRFLHAVENSGWVITYAIDASSGTLSFVKETQGANGYWASAFHWSEPLAVILGIHPVALNVRRVDTSTGELLDASAPVAIADGLQPHASGTLFFDASGGFVCVVVDDPSALGSATRVQTYNLATSGKLTGPVDDKPVGEGANPSIIVVRRGMSVQSGVAGAAGQ